MKKQLTAVLLGSAHGLRHPDSGKIGSSRIRR